MIGITYSDLFATPPHTLYREYFQKKAFDYPLFLIDARQRDDVLLLIEALLANAEVRL